MATCLICSSDLLLHAFGNHLYWYCDLCRESFDPDLLLRYSPLSMQSFSSPRYRHSLPNPLRQNTKPKSHPIECLYRNETLHPQIIRINNLPNVNLERVVMAGQCITFQTLSTAKLEVISGPMTSMIADRIPCRALSLRSLKSPPPQITSRLASPQHHQSQSSQS